MSLPVGDDEHDSPSRRDGNNPVLRPPQNKPQLLEATMRNVPKLKELNYTQWKNVVTNSIKKAKLWGYIDGSIEEPAEHDDTNLATYFDEAAAVRGAILGSLESEARRYIEEALGPGDAWIALEKKYLTAEAETDTKLVSIEQRLADLRYEEGGDMIEHIAEFCRMRCHLNGTCLALDDQASISMLYRSLPPSYRQSVLTPERTEMTDFGALCARLSDLSQNPEPEVDTPPVPVEDYTSWGVPEDIKAFGLTGGKNPLLSERAAVTCRDCLLKDHKAGTPECPQYEWRKELWGSEINGASPKPGDSGNDPSDERSMLISSNRLGYEFSEPVKVVLDFDELGLKPNLKEKILYSKPSTIQQCGILPIIHGRNILAQAPPQNGKTTALIISVLQVIDPTLSHGQALFFTPTNDATTALQRAVTSLGSGLSVRCASDFFSGTDPSSFPEINKNHILVGTPDYLLELTRRNMISMRKVRIIVLDDIDKLVEAEMEDPILEVVASSTEHSLSISKVVTRLLADPLQILVHRNEGITTGTHICIIIPAEQKINVLHMSFSILKTKGVMLLCRDIPNTSNPNNSSSVDYRYEYLHESMESSRRANVIQGFKYKLLYLQTPQLYNPPMPASHFQFHHGSHTPVYRNPTGYVALVTTDAAFSTTAELSNIGVPLINYDVPNNVGDYARRLDKWYLANPRRNQTILTFVVADTDEIRVIQELERCYGVHTAQLLWNPDEKKFC